MFGNRYNRYPHKLHEPERCLGEDTRLRWNKSHLESATGTFLFRAREFSRCGAALTLEQKEKILPQLRSLVQCGWPVEYAKALIWSRVEDRKSLLHAGDALRSIGIFSGAYGLEHRHAMHIAMYYIGEVLEDAAAKAGFRPDQPRHPSGSPTGGQWSGGMGEGGGRVRAPSPKPSLVTLPSRKPEPGAPPGNSLPRRRPERQPHPHEDSPLYDPETGIYEPPINPTWSPLDLIGLPARSAVGATGRIAQPLATEAAREARHMYNLAKLRYIRRDVRKLTEVGKGADGLTKPQMQNLKRMKKRNPDMRGGIEVTRYSDGSAVARFDKPARNVPNSHAAYEKHISTDGASKYVIKTTYAPDGKIVHIHPKNP